MTNKLLYSGNYGSFSWKVAVLAQAQNSELEKLPLTESLDPPTAIRELWAGRGSHAVIPIFNLSLGGPIPSAVLNLAQVNCPLPDANTPPDKWVETFVELNKDKVVGSPISLPIEFSIHALPGVKAEEVTRLAAYSMAVDQCRLGIERVARRTFKDVPYSDTGKAAHDLRRLADDPTYESIEPESAGLKPLSQTAILGPTWCKELFGLNTLWSGVQDVPTGNVTTFVVLRNSSL